MTHFVAEVKITEVTDPVPPIKDRYGNAEQDGEPIRFTDLLTVKLRSATLNGLVQKVINHTSESEAL